MILYTIMMIIGIFIVGMIILFFGVVIFIGFLIANGIIMLKKNQEVLAIC